MSPLWRQIFKDVVSHPKAKGRPGDFFDQESSAKWDVFSILLGHADEKKYAGMEGVVYQRVAKYR